MNKTNYKQYDTRWGNLGYPKKPWYIRNCGCGEVSICNCIIEMDKYKNETPKTIQPYCKQYAAPDGNGTYWSGIPKMMKYYGMTEVKEHANMASLWKELAKGNRVAVYLMGNRKGGSKGVHWTSSGHFVCSVAYKVENGKHMVYVKDSNSTSSDRNGWISYEGNMKNDVTAVWSGKLSGAPAPTPTPTPTPKPKKGIYTGKYPAPKKYLEKGDKGTEVTHLQQYLNWSFGGQAGFTKLAEDGIYGNDTYKWTCLWQNEAMGKGQGNGEVGPKTIAKMKEYGSYNPTPTPPSPTPSPDKTDYKVIDVSAAQSAIDWAKVKAAGIKGAIIRCGYRGYVTAKLNEDRMFQNHIKGAHKAGLPVGVYFFTQAINEAEGRAEADYAISLAEKMGIPLSYPIGIDTEHQSKEDKEDPEPRANNISKTKRTEAIKGFCERCLERGYRPMIYASTEWFKSKLDMSKLPYDIWCAQWASKCEYKGDIVMWQYTNKGKVNGISGNVDMNHCYIEPKINAPAPKPVEPPKAEPKGYEGKLPTFPTKVSVSKASILADLANEYAYTSSTSKAKYSTGKPKESYKKGLNKAYPDRSGWGKKAKAGASCDVFVGVCVRNAGIDPKYPRGLSASYTGKSGKFDKIAKANVKTGDLIFLPSHVCIAYEGKVKEASNGDNAFYPETSNALKKRVNSAEVIYRAKGTATIERNYIQRGDSGEAITELQNYLNWYTDGKFFKECGGADGIFGPNTEKYTKAMQADFFGASEADGLVGPKTVAKMADVRK